jgi:uncharacterized protein YdcH (DUF465 family)
MVKTEYLSVKHAKIDERVAELGTRRVLSADEAEELRRLKKQKLQAKDEIASLGTSDG